MVLDTLEMGGTYTVDVERAWFELQERLQAIHTGDGESGGTADACSESLELIQNILRWVTRGGFLPGGFMSRPALEFVLDAIEESLHELLEVLEQERPFSD